MNIAQMLKQAQGMQAKMQEMQERLAITEVQGQSGGGKVQITMTAKGDARTLAIDPTLLDPTEVEMLQDLIVVAINDARAKAEAMIARESEAMMGGMKMPAGLKLPF